jgi:hypothetical protein
LAEGWQFFSRPLQHRRLQVPYKPLAHCIHSGGLPIDHCVTLNCGSIQLYLMFGVLNLFELRVSDLALRICSQAFAALRDFEVAQGNRLRRTLALL